MAMTPEEFERLKAREREHLEKIRELKRAVGQLERQRSVADALARLQDSAQELMERNTELVDQIARETAHLEARADIGLEGEVSKHSSDPGVDEDEMRRLRAQSLIETIKAESRQSEPGPHFEPQSGQSVEEEKPHTEAPEKTIGRMR